uniref:Uncharacterized protein n=1 Tax=Oryza meridionalis TaxID=40149 RepID=A0A0E0DB14_9ORYZ
MSVRLSLVEAITPTFTLHLAREEIIYYGGLEEIVDPTRRRDLKAHGRRHCGCCSGGATTVGQRSCSRLSPCGQTYL